MKKEQNKTQKKSISEMPSGVITKVFRNQKIYKRAQPWLDPIFKTDKNSLSLYDGSGWILLDVLDDDVLGWKSFK